MVEKIEQLLTPDEVSDVLNVSRSHIYQVLREGIIPSVRIGKAVRVRPQDLRAFIGHALEKREVTNDQIQ